MNSHFYAIIKSAIKNKQQITADYDGRYREMCPHAIGTKNGVEQALFFQFGGNSSKGEITTDTKDNWRCITIDKLSNVKVKDGDWHTFSNHSKFSTCIDSIDLEVSY